MSSPGPFPSLLIQADKLGAQGAFAESQAAFLKPDKAAVDELDERLKANNVGVVAHFYMDPELQGVLTACSWPHVAISDSLLMAKNAIKMAEAGVKTIVVLGVDFMSENVRAMLDASGHRSVMVYRVKAEAIGCSLAESAEAAAYGAFLAKAAEKPRSLHVIYINTSLEVKARAHHVVPTITCTSSNVVKTILQATAEIPNLTIWYGPDTYMGENLKALFEGLVEMSDKSIAALHPAHDRTTVGALLSRFEYFKQGTCIVHHMFGDDVVKTTKEHYEDVYITAHLEVPGEMFGMALAAQRKGRGVVGSTSNILSFINKKLEEHAAKQRGKRLRFILGTEAGMITSIVRDVQKTLAAVNVDGLEVEVIFPVASEAVAQTDDAELGVVPGVAGGEGCTTAGGCATCPYMKMNSLDSLMELLEKQSDPATNKLETFQPKKYQDTIGGRTAADLGGEPIMHMRHFQENGYMSPELVGHVTRKRSTKPKTTSATT